MKPVALRRLAGPILLAGAIVAGTSGCSTAATPAPAATGALQPGSSAAPGPTTAPSAGPASPGAPTAAPTVSPVTSASSVATVGPGPTVTAAPTSPMPTGPVPIASPRQFLTIPGASIALLTPETGVGPSPRFEWNAVPGAARYLLFVFDTNGQMFWGWDGTATSVYLGGLDNPPTPGTMGPVLDAPMTWAVIAYDAAGKLIASSPTRPIAP